jgi:hypothetical protein
MTRHLAARQDEWGTELPEPRDTRVRLAEPAERPSRPSPSFLDRISRPRLRPSGRARVRR